MTELFLAQLEREAPGTRPALERVPEGKNEWKPHPRSMPLGYLAVLIANMPRWISLIIDRNVRAQEESKKAETRQLRLDKALETLTR